MQWWSTSSPQPWLAPSAQTGTAYSAIVVQSNQLLDQDLVPAKHPKLLNLDAVLWKSLANKGLSKWIFKNSWEKFKVVASRHISTSVNYQSMNTPKRKWPPHRKQVLFSVCIPVTNAQTKHHLMLLTTVFKESVSFSFTAFPAQPFCLWR